MEEIRSIIATQLVKLKINNPLAFVGIQLSLYLYTMGVVDVELMNSLLGRAGFDPNNVPVELQRLLSLSKFITGGLLGIISASTFKDLKEDNPIKVEAKLKSEE